MKQYIKLLNSILSTSSPKEDRTGTGTSSIFGYQMRFDLQKGFPIVTTKKINFKAVLNEFLWMVVEGSTDVRWLQERGHSFWNEWQKADGTIGPGYGYQFRHLKVDQVQSVIDSIKSNPNSRRHIISLWNPETNNECSLPPCHGNIIQFNVRQNKYLDCQMYQRSGDALIGVPFNISFYSIMLHAFAHLTGYEVGEFIHTIGDVHIYNNHVDQVNEQLLRVPYKLPELIIKRQVNDINDFKFEDFDLVNYQHHPAIKAPIAV